MGDKAYLDLNGDGQEEIFVSFYPAVNSMPLTEWFVLEKTEDGWEGENPFDATAHYEQMNEELEIGNNAYEVFADGRYEVGDVVGEPLPWGIWEIQSGTYDGENCLITQHGLGGPSGKYDYYGNVDVYFNYDANGKIKILDMEFEPEKTDAALYSTTDEVMDSNTYFEKVWAREE